MIGVVGPDRTTAQLADAIEEAGGSSLVSDAAEVAEAADVAIVAAGESALSEVAGLDVDVPVLPVDADPEFETSADAVARLVDDEYEITPHPVLDVRVGGEGTDRALFDVMLDTADPGRISEYGVESDGRTSRFRADGVVVATPAGTRGYASAAGGPVLDRDVAAVAVVPIAAFEIGADPRVAEPPLALTVERDDCPVVLLVDGREHEQVGPDRPVEVSIGGELNVVCARTGLEKH